MNNQYEYAKGNLRAHFLENTGRVMTSDELREVAGRPEWALWVSEFRDKEGYQILTQQDYGDLKPCEYLLETYKPLPDFAPEIAEAVRATAIAHGDFYCYKCGAVSGDPHLYDSTRNVRLQIGHIIDKTMGGTDDPSNSVQIAMKAHQTLP